MLHENFNWKENGFVGHLAEPDCGSDKAVIVVMGGEQSVLPGVKIAERFADYGFIGLAVSLFGAEGLPDSADQCPLEMFEKAINYLRKQKKYGHEVKAIVYPNVSHLTGIMPNKDREKQLYRLLPLIGILYKSFGKHKKDCMDALVKSENEIINWLNGR